MTDSFYLIDYKGLSVLDVVPYGEAGKAFYDNFKTISDRIGPCNYTATLSPVVTNDINDGYFVGSKWYNTISNISYECIDNTAGAALWITPYSTADVWDSSKPNPVDMSWLHDCQSEAFDVADGGTAPAGTGWRLYTGLEGSITVLEIDSEIKIHGQQSLKITGGDAIGTAICDLPETVNVRGGFGAILRVSDLASLNKLIFWISEDINAVYNGYRMEVPVTGLTNNTGQPITNNEWFIFWISRQELSESGGTVTPWGPSGTETYPVKSVAISLDATTGDTTTIHFGGLIQQEPLKAGLIISFDDGLKEVYTNAYPIMSAYGLRGQLYINVDRIGLSDSYMTWDELDVLYAAGWGIGSHMTPLHQKMDGTVVVSDAQAAAWISRNQRILEQRYPDTAAFGSWPYTIGDTTGHVATDIAENLGLLSIRGRGSTEGLSTFNIFTGGQAAGLWIDSPLQRSAYPLYTGDAEDFSAVCQGVFEQLIIDKGLCYSYTHRILESDPGTINNTIAFLRGLCAWVAPQVKAGNLWVLTDAEAHRMTYGSPRDIFWGKNGLLYRRTSTGIETYLNRDTVKEELAIETNSSNIHTSANPNVLVPKESGKIYTNEGSTEKNYITLPSAFAGLNYTFIVQDADGIRITAAAGDTIRIGSVVSAVAGYTESTTIGAVINLIAINNTEWIGVVQNG